MSIHITSEQVQRLAHVVSRQSPELMPMARLCLDSGNEYLFMEYIITTVLRATQEEGNERYREGVEDGKVEQIRLNNWYRQAVEVGQRDVMEQREMEVKVEVGQIEKIEIADAPLPAADVVPSDRSLGESDTDTDSTEDYISLTRKRQRHCKKIKIAHHHH